MPRGTRHEIVGLLLKSGRGFVLDVSGGGTWRLDLGWRAGWRVRHLVGLRVKIAGVRGGFDLMEVDRIEAAT